MDESPLPALNQDRRKASGPKMAPQREPRAVHGREEQGWMKLGKRGLIRALIDPQRSWELPAKEGDSMGQADPGPRSPGVGNIVQAPAHPLSSSRQQSGLELRTRRPVPSVAVSAQRGPGNPGPLSVHQVDKEVHVQG